MFVGEFAVLVCLCLCLCVCVRCWSACVFDVLVSLFVRSCACVFLCLLGLVCLVLRGCSDVCACVMWLFGWFYLFVFLSLWLVSIVVYVLVVCVFACVCFVLWVECVLFCLFVWLCVCISLGFACHGLSVFYLFVWFVDFVCLFHLEFCLFVLFVRLFVCLWWRAWTRASLCSSERLGPRASSVV